MNIKFLTSLAAASAISLGSAGAITYNIQFTLAEVAGIGEGVPGILVVDTGGDGFTGFDSLAGNSFATGANLGDGNDVIIASLTSVDFGGLIGYDAGTIAVNTDSGALGGLGLDANQQMAFYWFPQGNSNTGSSFGMYRDSTITDPAYGASRGYITPTAGNTDTILSVTSSVDLGGGAGNVDPNLLGPAALLTIGVPEPSSMMLLFTGLAGFLLRRRR